MWLVVVIIVDWLMLHIVIYVMVVWCPGIPDDRDGLFDTILLSKNQYQKRAYQCIKMMVSLFTLYVGSLLIALQWSLKFVWDLAGGFECL